MPGRDKWMRTTRNYPDGRRHVCPPVARRGTRIVSIIIDLIVAREMTR
jgi:hypothetical protein